MQHLTKRSASIVTAVLVIVAGLIGTTIYLGTRANGNGCNESSTIPPQYNDNASSLTEVALSMASGCKATFQINWNGSTPSMTNASSVTFDMTNTNGSYGAFVGPFVGEWYHYYSGGSYSGIKLVQNDVINISVDPQTLTTTNKSFTHSCGYCYYFDFNYTITIQTAHSTQGFYMLYLPSNTMVPVAVGYSIAQINMTKDYPDFEDMIPPPALLGSAFGTSIVRMSGASLGNVD